MKLVENRYKSRCEISVAGSCQRVKKIITRLILIQTLRVVSLFEPEIRQKKMLYKFYSEKKFWFAGSSQKAEKS